MLAFRILFFLTLFGSSVFAQDLFSLEPNPAFSQGLSTSNFTNVHATLTNLTDEAQPLVWERMDVLIPKGWETYACNELVCGLPDQDIGYFTVQPNQTITFDFAYIPYGIGGSGQATLRVYPEDNPDNFQDIVYKTVIEQIVSNQSLPNVDVIAFPNPAKTAIQFESVIIQKRINVFNSTGNLLEIKENLGRNFTLELNAFPQGLYHYFIDLENNERHYGSFIKL